MVIEAFSAAGNLFAVRITMRVWAGVTDALKKI